MFSHELCVFLFFFCSYLKFGFLILGSGFAFWFLQDASYVSAFKTDCGWLMARGWGPLVHGRGFTEAKGVMCSSKV